MRKASYEGALHRERQPANLYATRVTVRRALAIGVSHQLNRFLGIPEKDPFLIRTDEWLRVVVSDRHTFFDARWAPRNLRRFLRQSTDVAPNVESADSLHHISNVDRAA